MFIANVEKKKVACTCSTKSIATKNISIINVKNYCRSCGKIYIRMQPCCGRCQMCCLC